MGNEWLAGWLAEIFNRYISLDPEAPGKIAAFDGKIIALQLKGLDRTFYLSILGSRVHVSGQVDGQVDTTIAGTPSALFRMGAADNVSFMLLKSEVEITGDMRLGRAFNKLLAELDIDWEEYLARVVGDVAAHQAMSLAGKLSRWGRQTRNALAEDVAEYLQEESRDVISAAELERFYEDVDLLRNDVDRLYARFDQLKGLSIYS